MKKAVIILIAFMCAFSFSGCITQSDVDDAYNRGYEAGNSAGFEEGYDFGMEELERRCEIAEIDGYAKGKADAGNESGVRYIEVPKFYSADQEEMYDEIWDEIYERAYEDAYSEAREDIVQDFDLDLDY